MLDLDDLRLMLMFFDIDYMLLPVTMVDFNKDYSYNFDLEFVHKIFNENLMRLVYKDQVCTSK